MAYISAGLQVVKLASAVGRLSGLPIPACAGLPTNIVAKAEMQALDTFEEMVGTVHEVRGMPSARARTRGEPTWPALALSLATTWWQPPS